MITTTIYALPGCKRCEYVIKKLHELSVPHEIYVCKEDSEFCDNLEDFTGCSTYPIVRVTNTNSGDIYMNARGIETKSIKLAGSDILELHASLDLMVKRIYELYTNQ